MRILYIFPHPDDESFGPAPVIKAQVDQGHEVFLLTLTRGGAAEIHREKLELQCLTNGRHSISRMLKVAEVLHSKE